MDNNFFQHNGLYAKPEKGDLLISEPFLPDTNFSRTVVLLCEHNEDGSFGFVLNKKSDLFLPDLIDGFSSKVNYEVYIGGPVQQNTLHFIHKMPERLENSVEVKNGLYWGGDFEQLKVILENEAVSSSEIKFFVGYSGWGKDQLKGELKENSWIISKKADLEHIFDTKPEMLWKQALEDMGGKFRMFSNYPVDPRLN